MPIEDLDRLARAPRDVPFSLAVRLRFGGAFGNIGWLFLTIGLGFLFGFSVIAHPVVVLKLAWTETATVEGRVLGWSDTSVSVNEQPVVATHFEYTVDGEVYEGASFAVDRAPDPDTRVKVVYAVGDPRASKIDGMMAGQAPLWVIAMLLIFPVVGLFLALVNLRRGSRELRALRHGRAGRAVATEHHPTGTRVNGVPEYAVTFEYADHLGQRHSVTQKTLAPMALLDEPEEPLLFLPNRPQVAVLLDSRPDVITLDADGHFRPRSALSTLGTLLPVLLTLGLVATAVLASL